jgi:hypothetical protein
MAGQNLLQITTAGASINQGAYGAPLDPKRWRAIVITPATYYLTPTHVAAIKAKLQGDAIAASQDARIQVLGVIDGCKPTGTAPVSTNSGYGLAKKRYGAQYAYDVTFADSDVHKTENRQKLNDRDDLKAYIVDEDDLMLSTLGDDGSGNKVYMGFSLHQIYTDNIPFDGDEIAKPMTNIAFADSREFNHGNMVPISLGFNINTTIKPVMDVTLQPKSALTTRVVSLAVMGNAWGGLNLAQKYATELASTSLWTVKDYDLGTTLTITSVVAAVIDGINVLTFTIAVTSYPSSGGRISIQGSSPSAWATAGVKYYETDLLILTV